MSTVIFPSALEPPKNTKNLRHTYIGFKGKTEIVIFVKPQS